MSADGAASGLMLCKVARIDWDREVVCVCVNHSGDLEGWQVNWPVLSGRATGWALRTGSLRVAFWPVGL